MKAGKTKAPLGNDKELNFSWSKVTTEQTFSYKGELLMMSVCSCNIIHGQRTLCSEPTDFNFTRKTKRILTLPAIMK